MLVTCLECGQEFHKKDSQIKKSPNHFCSRSCSAKYTNRQRSSDSYRQPEGNCIECDTPISTKRTYCDKCWNSKKITTKTKKVCQCGKPCKGESCRKCWLSSNSKLKICVDCGEECRSKRCWKCHVQHLRLSVENDTIADVINYKHHPSSAHALIRTRARAISKRLGWSSCCNCGYDTHIEIAHRRAITDFSEDTLVSVVNTEDNLAPLCPNCHWEFDHGLLEL